MGQLLRVGNRPGKGRARLARRRDPPDGDSHANPDADAPGVDSDRDSDPDSAAANSDTDENPDADSDSRMHRLGRRRILRGYRASTRLQRQQQQGTPRRERHQGGIRL